MTLQIRPVLTTLDEYEIYLFDLWGVIGEGDRIYPGISETINYLIQHKQVFFITNVPRPNFAVQAKLTSWGIRDVKENMIVTAGDIARKIITAYANSWSGSDQQGKSDATIIQQKINSKPVIYHLGSDRNDEILARLPEQVNDNITVTDNLNQANILLLTLYRDVGENLLEFNNLFNRVVKNNILTICVNPDVTIVKDGRIRYCAGYFANIIKEQGGEIIYTGKPQNVIYQEILTRINLDQKQIPRKKVLMIGDTFETDITGGINAGISTALVMTGNSYFLHHQFNSIESKLEAIYKEAIRLGIMPDFITSLS